MVGKAGDLEPQPGLVIGNELIDALSFWLIRWEEGQWWEKRVAREGEGFTFENAEPNGDLADRLALVEGRFSEGYETELRPSLAPLLAEMKSVLTSGEILLFDYGFERNDLYHPSRTTGTLRTYGRHKADEDPLVHLGQLDITAHVDFTALEEDAQSIGLTPQALTSQGHFLTKAAASFPHQNGRASGSELHPPIPNFDSPRSPWNEVFGVSGNGLNWERWSAHTSFFLSQRDIQKVAPRKRRRSAPRGFPTTRKSKQACDIEFRTDQIAAIRECSRWREFLMSWRRKAFAVAQGSSSSLLRERLLWS